MVLAIKTACLALIMFILTILAIKASLDHYIDYLVYLYRVREIY